MFTVKKSMKFNCNYIVLMILFITKNFEKKKFQHLKKFEFSNSIKTEPTFGTPLCDSKFDTIANNFIIKCD